MNSELRRKGVTYILDLLESLTVNHFLDAIMTKELLNV